MWWKLDSRLIKMSHSEPPHWIKLESRGQEWCFVSLPETTYSLVPVNMILCLSVCACLCICVYVYTAAWNQERVVMFSEDVCSFTQRGKTKQQTTATTSLNRGNDLNSSTPLLSHSLSLLSYGVGWLWFCMLQPCVYVVIWWRPHAGWEMQSDCTHTCDDRHQCINSGSFPNCSFAIWQHFYQKGTPLVSVKVHCWKWQGNFVYSKSIKIKAMFFDYFFVICSLFLRRKKHLLKS